VPGVRFRLATVPLLAALLLPTVADAKVRDVTYRYGPITVGRYDGVRGGNPVRAPRMDGSIVEMDAFIVDKRNRVIPQSKVMLHHLVFKNLGHSTNVRRDGACPGSRGDQRFYGESEELRALTLPRGYGYRIDREDRWRMGWMVMNHTHRVRQAWIRYHVKIDTRRLRPVTPYWLSVMGCHVDPQFTVPGTGAKPAATYKRSKTFAVPRDGRIVAVGGHLHGGGRGISLSQPRCGNRTLVSSKPTYGRPDDPVYAVKPLLHEPDPRNITWWQSGTGIPVKKGELLRVAAKYRNDFPYMRVMGIDHVYIAHGARAPGGCAKLPADAQELGPDFLGREAPPHMDLTLAAMGKDGYAHPIGAPPGAERRFDSRGEVTERFHEFAPRRLSIPAGGSVRWTFQDQDLHDATLVTGPRGFSSPPIWGGAYTHRFNVPGTYRIYCSLHPVYMTQVVTVRGK
jgi:plastocyanin